MKQPIHSVDPGTGALEFAMSFVGEEITLANVQPIVRKLMAGELHDPTNKKVKTCAFCGYYYSDKTKPNNSVVCSPECRNARKAAKERKIYVPAEHFVPLGLTLEYPFYKDVKTMNEFARKESLHSPDNIARIQAARDRKLMNGGRKKKKEVIVYDGDEKGKHGVKVKMPKSDQAERKVTVYKMSREEIEAYLAETYSEEKLMQERWRAQDFERQRFQYV